MDDSLNKKMNVPVAIVGCGTLGSLIAKKISRGNAGAYKVAALMDIPCPQKAEELSGETSGKVCKNLDELLAVNPEFVIEAGNRNTLTEIAEKCLLSGASIVCLSTGAFTEKLWAERVWQVANKTGKKVYLASGAIGAFDIAQSAAAMGFLEAKIMTEKPPRALMGAPALKNVSLSEKDRETVFLGAAVKAVEGFPQNVNVVASLGLATQKMDSLQVEVISDPTLDRNRHTVTLEGEFGRAILMVEAKPSPQNPKSSLLAGYSVLALLKRIASPVQFG